MNCSKNPGMNRKMNLLILLLAASLPMNVALGADDWVTLFNGHNLDGWTERNKSGSFRVEEGAIIGTAKEGLGSTFLCTDEVYADFELEFETKLIDPELNSGVQIRSGNRKPTGNQKVGPVEGPQVEFSAKNPEKGSFSGNIYGQGWKGWLTPKDERRKHNFVKSGEWNHFRVLAKGDQVTTWINGHKVITTTIPAERHQTHSSGFIGLQIHGIKDGTGPFKVAWRKIRIRRLNKAVAKPQLGGASNASPARTSPNIIFFLSDDQGYGDLSCYGSKVIATPNIDRLASEGMKFNSFYVHNRCSPTRAAFMTGSHAGRTGIGNVVYRWEGNGINQAEITIAELLKGAGYATGMVGKWHLGSWEPFNPVHHGFDSFYGFFYEDDETKGLFKDLEMVEKIGSQTDGIHSPKLLQAGINFIRNVTTKNQEQGTKKPFFLYYASPLPHTRWIPHEDFAGTSKQGTYGDVIQEIDWQVGGLLDTLDELELTENTLVIFASDNGPQLNVEGHGSAGPLRDGKWTNFEGGIRVPCLMRWPGKIPAGSINNEITGIIDMLPTFCVLSGANVPTDRVIDGKNILPYLLGKKVERPIHETFVVPGSAIRHGDWKLLVKGQKPGGSGTKGKQGREPAKAGSLFNLKNDLGERTDVSAQHPEKVQQLRQLMTAYMKEFEANKRPTGWIEGYNEERATEAKRARTSAKKASKEAKEKKRRSKRE